MQTREKDNRRDWLIILFIILVGFLCILLTSGWALRLTPSWSLDSDMGSRIDPNSLFLTERAKGYLEPIDESILTLPPWLISDAFLTPNAFITRTPQPTAVNTLPPSTRTSAPTGSPTLALTVTPTRTTTSAPPTRTSVVVFTPTVTRTPLPATDLRITKTDGSATYIVGGAITYTIVVTNPIGPSNATGATVTDTFPAELVGITWTCVGAGGGTCPANGAGNINNTVNLPVGSSVTYTVNATVSPAASGNLVNTARVTAPAGISDTTPANNTAVDTDTPLFNVDLQITKTDGVATYNPGGSVTYTIVVSNAGPANATGALVTDTFPAQVTSVTWTCVSAGGATCPANGTGNINNTVNIPVSGTLTYTAVANISSAATGTLDNTATVTAPGGYTEIAPGNNSATDSDTPAVNADLQITKTDGVTDYTTTATRTYTIVVTNAGPSNVTGATVTDNFPAQVSGATWSCAATGGAACTANGTGTIADTVNIPVGGTLTYTATVTINASATGDLVNTATVTGPVGSVDPVPGNNSATDTDIPYVDLQVTKDDGSATYTAGGAAAYTVTVTNNSTFNLTGITLSDAIPNLVTTWGWCVAPCAPVANTSTDLSDTLNLAAGTSATYNITANIHPNAAGDLVNTATVTPPAGYTDAVPGNDSATDTDINQTGEPDIGPPDNDVYNIADNGSVTFYLSQPIVANADAAADFVFYEVAVGPDILIDHLVIEISQDGVTWYQVFFWGDAVIDSNTNVSRSLAPINAACPIETDNCTIPLTELYNNTGITVDVDNSPYGAVPLGNYNYIRFTEPGLGSTDGAHVDSIEIITP